MKILACLEGWVHLQRQRLERVFQEEKTKGYGHCLLASRGHRKDALGWYSEGREQNVWPSVKIPQRSTSKVYGYLPSPPSPVLPNSATITLATLPHFSLVHTIYLLKWEHDTQCRVPLSWDCAHITPTKSMVRGLCLSSVGSGWDKDHTKERNTYEAGNTHSAVSKGIFIESWFRNSDLLL